MNGLSDSIPGRDLSGLAEAIESGSIKRLIVAGEDITQLGVSVELLKRVEIVYFGSHANQISQVAKVVCPSLSVFEKEGSFVNISSGFRDLLLPFRGQGESDRIGQYLSAYSSH